MAVNVDEFVDEGMKEAGIETEVTETEEPEVKEPETKVEDTTEETPSVMESFLDSEPEKKAAEKEPTMVPVHVLQEERQRRRDAEEKLKGFSQSPPDGAKFAVDEILAGDEDDLLTRGEVKKLVSSLQRANPQKSNADIVEQVKSIIEQDRMASQLQQTRQLAIASEKEAKEANADFEKVVNTAKNLGLINDVDRKKAFSSAKPAQVLYDISKAKLDEIRSTLGVSTPTGKPKKEDNNNVPSDDDIFNEVFSSEE